ncbi:MAG: hypothetical protein KDA61_08135 [Planctomycetales bacterium]|nr:hypothetical protein [Planctomycetales bacterium]
MKKIFPIACLAAMLTTFVGGCKTAPQLAWWKKDAATAVANQPADPADAAKLAAASVDGATSANVAPPFVPSEAAVDTLVAAATTTSGAAGPYPSTASSTPQGYPTTGVGAASADAAVAAVAAASRQMQDTAGATLGSIAVPYDPSAVPGGTTPTTLAGAAQEMANQAVATADRYGRYAVASTANTVSENAAAVAQAVAPPAGQATRAPETGLPYQAGSVAAAAPQVEAAPSQYGVGDRYASSASVAASGAGAASYGSVSPYGTPAAPSVPATTTNIDASVAQTSAQSYRPGGTTTYPTTQVAATASVPKVASLPSGQASSGSQPGSAASYPTTSYPTGNYPTGSYPPSGYPTTGSSPSDLGAAGTSAPSGASYPSTGYR